MLKLGLVTAIVGALGYLYLKIKDAFEGKQIQKDTAAVAQDTAKIQQQQTTVNQDEEELDALIKNYKSDSSDGTEH